MWGLAKQDFIYREFREIHIATYNYIGANEISHGSQTIIILLNQIVFILLMASANRALNIRMLNILILIAQINLVNMGLFSVAAINTNIALFQIINSLLIFLAIEIILRSHQQKSNTKAIRSNSLAISGMYFTVLLFLWIGLPGTASFVSEINIFTSLVHESLILVLIAAIGFIMLAIAVLHALQEHVFTKESSFLTVHARLSIGEHIFVIFCIVTNIFNGINPNMLLNQLAH